MFASGSEPFTIIAGTGEQITDLSMHDTSDANVGNEIDSSDVNDAPDVGSDVPSDMASTGSDLFDDVASGFRPGDS